MAGIFINLEAKTCRQSKQLKYLKGNGTETIWMDMDDILTQKETYTWVNFAMEWNKTTGYISLQMETLTMANGTETSFMEWVPIYTKRHKKHAFATGIMAKLSIQEMKIFKYWIKMAIVFF